MAFALLGWPEDGPRLDLDHRAFSYAGKFVMSNTGKAVALESGAGGAGTETMAGTGTVDAGTGPETATPERRSEPPDREDFVDPEGTVVGAAAFNEDRTDASVCWIRYLTVRTDRRGDGIGPRLASFVATRARQRGYERVRIAVNNPFAYEALYRAGFRFTGEETGVAELVLERALGDDREAATASESATEAYQAGLDVFRERDLSDAEAEFLDEKRGTDPPSVVDSPQ